jgi:hypothetical protein
MSAAFKTAGYSILDREKRHWKLDFIGQDDIIGLGQLKFGSIFDKGLAS